MPEAVLFGLLCALCVTTLVLWQGRTQLKREAKAHRDSRIIAEEALSLAQIEFAESKGRLAAIEADYATLRDTLSAMEKEIREYTAKLATAHSIKLALEEKLKDQQSYVQQAQMQFQQQFENLANKIFAEKNEQSKKNLAELLSPLKEDIGGFKKHITESFGNHAKEQFALKNEIQNIVKVSNEMKFQTESLSKALKGDTKVQGNWGEMILERILEVSGLRKGENYNTQGTGMGLKHPEHGGSQKPDVIIYLPEGKHAIIDAKVTLTSYERYCAEENDAARTEHLVQFMLAVKNRVRELEERRYQDTAGLDTPDYTLMFMPIEGAYALAMQQDPELHAHAWDKKVIIVCPSTLFAILKIIASMWKLERQNKNADEIAKRGGMLYDKVVNFVSEMQKIGKSLKVAQDGYDAAMKKLSERGGILVDTEKMKQLGVKHAKSLPQELLNDAETGDLPTLVQLPKDAA